MLTVVQAQPLDSQPPVIGDYGLIGDCRSAALVSSEGSIDWLCWPRFDSPSIFAALLDTRTGGRFQVRPSDPFEVERRYLPDTNVIETIFHCDGGSVALRDLMPVASEEYKQTAFMAEYEILREIECLSGAVTMEIFYDPRPDYGREQVAMERRGQLGLAHECPNGTLLLRSDVALALSPDRSNASGQTTLREGDRRHLSLSYSRIAPAVVPPLGDAAHERLDRTVAWWQEWAARSSYTGPYREAVIRSALTLKLMVYAPSGAVIAAPTTSLPEKIGGERNWDYRYCWLRDAAFTMRALMGLGYDEEASAYVDWLLHATRLTWPKLQVLYDVFGETNLPEKELEHLAGYAGSKPVRIGNDAKGQFQLDVYGEVVDAITRFLRSDGTMSKDTVHYLNGLGETVCENWRNPDEGIWEGRSGRKHHTHSKVLCWVALDCLIHLEETERVGLDADRFRTERDAIREEIERRGYNEKIGSYVQVYDEEYLDASLLTLPLYGYIDARHPRMVSTLARIQEELGKNGFVYRYTSETNDGLAPGEGAFGVCGFWAVECCALSGDTDGAIERFESLLGTSNDLGLLAEEMDPDTGEHLGNFPQAFTHVGVINAALTLAERMGDGSALNKEHGR